MARQEKYNDLVKKSKAVTSVALNSEIQEDELLRGKGRRNEYKIKKVVQASQRADSPDNAEIHDTVIRGGQLQNIVKDADGNFAKKGKHVNSTSKMNDGRIELLQNRVEGERNTLNDLGGDDDRHPKAEGKGAVPNALCLKETNKKDMYEFKTNYNSFKNKNTKDFPKHAPKTRLEQLGELRDQTNKDN